MFKKFGKVLLTAAILGLAYVAGGDLLFWYALSFFGI
jgi:hypothetical protein